MAGVLFHDARESDLLEQYPQFFGVPSFLLEANQLAPIGVSPIIFCILHFALCIFHFPFRILPSTFYLLSSPPMDYPATKAYLYGLKHQGPKYGIDRMRLLAARLGHPERACPVIHVAGTNGKGSVCAMIEAIYRHAGLRVGMYTSPHLVFLGERVQVNRQPLSPEDICRYVEELRPHTDALAAHDPDDLPSFFEFMTAMAFLRFAREKVDVALIEVGLGGRLDATNVVLPALCIITSIGFDHMEFLGNTLPEIAREKAGIIKPGVPVVIGHLPPEAEAAVRAVAAECNAPVHSVREIFGDDLAQYPQTRLEGSHQRINAATATLAVRVLGSILESEHGGSGTPRPTPDATVGSALPLDAPLFNSGQGRNGSPSPLRTPRRGVPTHEQILVPLVPPISDTAIAEALATVDWPARWQRFPLSENRQLILDASHNPEGAQTLDENLTRLRAETGRAPIILVGALGEHRARALLAVAAKHAREIVLLQPAQSRATPFEELEQFVPNTFSGPIHRGAVAKIFPAPGECALGQPGDTVVATGSIYLLGEILEHFSHSTLVGESVLQDSP